MLDSLPLPLPQWRGKVEGGCFIGTRQCIGMPSAATSSISLCWKVKVRMIVLQNGPVQELPSASPATRELSILELLIIKLQLNQ
jgi:hypothetical protein